MRQLLWARHHSRRLHLRPARSAHHALGDWRNEAECVHGQDDYRIDEQLSSISQFVTLEPGDVVLTGSPAGVVLPRGEFLKSGDKVIATAEGVGELPRCLRRRGEN
jgi:hypothetical protein